MNILITYRSIISFAIFIFFVSTAFAQSTSRSDGMGGFRHSDGSTSRSDGMGGFRHSDGSTSRSDGMGGFRHSK